MFDTAINCKQATNIKWMQKIKKGNESFEVQTNNKIRRGTNWE